MSNRNGINIDLKMKKKHLSIALIPIIGTSLILYQIFAQNQGITQGKKVLYEGNEKDK